MERFTYTPPEAEDWTPEPKSHYSDKGSHKKRSDHWKTLRRQMGEQHGAEIELGRGDLAAIATHQCDYLCESGVWIKACENCIKHR